MTGDTAGSVPVRRRSWWSIVVLAVLMMLGVIVATLVVIALIPLRVGDLGAQPRQGSGDGMALLARGMV